MKHVWCAGSILLLSAGWLSGCGSGEGSPPGVVVSPAQVTMRATGRQIFAATPPTVNWLVREGSAGGSISTYGLYAAPDTPGTYTVVAVETTSGATGEASVTVLPAAGNMSHGLSVPSAHPRLWYDAARLATAQAWYRKNSFTPARASPDILALDRALRGLLNGQDPRDQRTQCRAALEWAIGATAEMADRVDAGSSQWNLARWAGESIILAYDWCHAHLTPAERATFIAKTNTWMEARRTQVWGGVPMHQNNYYWGFTRNQIEWAIASYEDNVEMAETFLEDALVRRIQDDFDQAARTGARGGVFQEGSQYGPYVAAYATVPYVTAGLLGRDLLGETNFWKEAVYAFIYSMPPGSTHGLGYTFFPHCDAANGLSHSVVGRDSGAFMTAAAMRWRDVNVGKHARQWLALTRAPRTRIVESVDEGGSARAFTDLPLDYYAPGVRWLYGRTGWDASATAVFLQLGDRDSRHIGHAHTDWGTWQIWRGGRFLSRETATYLGNSRHYIAGYGGGGAAVDGVTAIAHNTILIDGAGSAANPAGQTGSVTVPRLESQPAYLFAVADLSSTAGNARYGNRGFVTWVRELVFVRGLETLVIFDRLESRSAGATKTFLAHCETNPAVGTGTATCKNGPQALVMTTLVPPASTYRVVTEGGAVGQYRIEVDTTPGTAQSYILTVLQAKDGGAAGLSPSVADGGSSYVLTLDGSTRLTFDKGMTSAGGSITVAGVTASFRKDVQSMTVTDDGPSWR